MATPFSPFVRRQHVKHVLKRRQSELPSDLIDWDAPEIPELEKERIIYEACINELKEDHEIEILLNEQIFMVAHDTLLEEHQSKVKCLEGEISKERSRVSLLLGQIKMFENNAKENDQRIDELENELTTQKNLILQFEQEKEDWSEEKLKFEQDKENWLEERNHLQTEIEDLNFRNNEISCESHHNFEIYNQIKNEVEDYKKKLDFAKSQLNYYKKVAKNKENNDE